METVIHAEWCFPQFAKLAFTRVLIIVDTTLVAWLVLQLTTGGGYDSIVSGTNRTHNGRSEEVSMTLLCATLVNCFDHP